MKYLKFFDSTHTNDELSVGDYIRISADFMKSKIAKIEEINGDGWYHVDFLNGVWNDIYSSDYNIEKLTELEINIIKYNL